MSAPRRSLVLIGAGGLARETADLVRALDGVGAGWDLAGYLDDNPELAGTTVAGLPVLGPIEHARGLTADPLVDLAVCTARPAVGCSRRRIVAELGIAPERFPALVHPQASLAASTEVGPGCIVFAGVVTTASVTLGAHVVVMPQVVLTHDDRVGDYATLASGVRLGGGVQVDAEAYLGAGALIREQVTIGASALVGMGAVVLHDVPSGQVWIGAPARRLDTPRPQAVGA